jgi:hypothetical protein
MSTLTRLYVQSGMALTSLLAAPSALAQGTFGPLPNIPGPTAADEGSIRQVILSVLNFVLNFLALVAVVVIVIAGIRLIVSQGEEEPREKAKKTIIYVVAGLIVILLAKVIVNFATNVFNNTIG